MLSYAYISAPVLTGNDSGFYHLMGVLAIVAGVICLVLIGILATPSARRDIRRWSLSRDPFDDSWSRQQTTFMDQVMKADPDTLTDTLIPGVTAVALPPDTGRPTVTVKPLVGVVVDEVPEPIDDGDAVLEEIRRSNREFLARIDSI